MPFPQPVHADIPENACRPRSSRLLAVISSLSAAFMPVSANADFVAPKVFGGSSLDVLAPREKLGVQTKMLGDIVAGFLKEHPRGPAIEWDAQGPQSCSLQRMLGFPDRVPALLEVAWGAQYEWWDEWMAIHGEKDEVRIDFQNPYVPNTAATVRLREAVGEGPSERVSPGTPATASRRQWQHFIAGVEGKVTPLTPLQGGLDDLELVERIITALPLKPGGGQA